MAFTATKSRLLISSSDADETWQDRLVSRLRGLELEGVLSTWDDGQISAGADWQVEIQTTSNACNVALLLNMADIHLHRARLFRDRVALQQACALIEQCGDWWRREALVEAEAVAGGWVDNG